MARRLRRNVVAGGVTYPAGTAESADLTNLIPNPRAWEGSPEPPAAPEPTPAPQAEVNEPPRSGRGSGTDAWRAYAQHLGIDVPDDASRDDIIELVDTRS